MTKIISPHLTIYRFPITAISSITVRVSGLYLSGLFVAGGASCLLNKENKIIDYYSTLSDNEKTALNYSVITPVTYHTVGGLRHFIWDKIPNVLNNKSVARSSIFLFGLTGVTSYLIENKLND